MFEQDSTTGTQDPTLDGEETEAVPRAAYQRLLPDIIAVPEERLITLNLDIPAIVSTGLGVLPEVRALEADIRKLHQFDITALDRLEEYAHALHHANVLYLAASSPPEELAELIERATAARDLLLTDIASFIAHGHIGSRRPEELERSLGHRGVAVDVGRLAQIVRESWPKLQGKTSLSLKKLREFETLSVKLLDTLGLKEQGEKLVVEVASKRHRIFTLFVRAYDEVRRAVSYLRWHQGDVDEITPSLYSGRAGRRRSEAAPAPAGSESPSTIAPAAPAAPVAQVPIGHPGSDPFGP